MIEPGLNSNIRESAWRLWASVTVTGTWIRKRLRV